MIQDIFPDKLDNHYENLSPAADSKALYFRDGRLLVHADAARQALVFPSFREFSADAPAVYLFSVGAERFFLILKTDLLPQGCEWYTMQELRRLERRSNAGIFAAFTAYHLWTWYGTSRFCGACGEKTAFDQRERAMVCPACGGRIYPRINPAVIVGVTDGDRLLLTRYQTGYTHNALVAGFTEIGETLEETVRREVMEEVGLRVKNIRYYKSQPWGVAADILVGFYCDVDGSSAIRRDDQELKYAEWVHRSAIRLQPTDDSLTNDMMKAFIAGTYPKENKR